MPSTNNPFFEVVSEDYSSDGSNDAPSGALAEFEERARQDGFGETVIERASKLSKGRCESYDAYLKLLDAGLDDIQNAKEQEILRRKNIQRSIDIEIEKIADSDVFALIDRKILDLYRTSSVTAIELVTECFKTFDANKQAMYKECRFAVYLCMKSDWVKNSLQICIDRWDSSMDIKRYVTAYLKRIKVEPENYNAGVRSLTSYLPQNLQSENSPIMYKAFRAVQLITARDWHDIPDFDQTVRERVSYYTGLCDCLDRNMPLLGAEQFATSVCAKQDELVPNANMLLGHSVSLFVPQCQNIVEAICYNLGDYAQEFYDDRAKKKEELEQKKMEDTIRKESKNASKVEPTVKVHDKPQRPMSTQSKVKQKQVVHQDFNPYMPPWLMFTIGGVVVSLITLLFGKAMFVLSLLFTSVASFGWYAKEHNMEVNGKPPLLLVAGGYGCFLLLLIFKIM